MKQLLARDVMNPEVIRVRDTMTAYELATFLVDQDISGAPVEDSEGRLVGVVSVTDLARASSEGGGSPLPRSDRGFFLSAFEDGLDREELRGLHLEEDGLRVRDIMTPKVFAVEEDDPVSDVARSMLEGHVHRLLVIRGGNVVGIISASDMLKLLLDEES